MRFQSNTARLRGIEPVHLLNRRLQVVNHQRLGNAPKGAKGVLQNPGEVLGVLLEDLLAVAFAGMTQDDS